MIAQGLIRTTDGRRAAYHDILINTDACKDYIQRGALDEVEEIMERSGFDGMVTSNQSVAASFDEAGVLRAKTPLPQAETQRAGASLAGTPLTVNCR